MSNSLEQRWYEKDWARLLFAIGLNVAFVIGIVLLFSPQYGLNDDPSIQEFMDGQMEQKTPYIMFCNYFLARVFIWLYDITSNAVPIYPLFQYALMGISFIGTCYVIFKRLPIIQAFTVSVCFLCLFGIDGTVNLTYTKTVGLCTVAAFLIMFQAMHERGTEKWLMLLIGGVLQQRQCC